MLIELKPDLFEHIENLQEVNQLLALFSDRRHYDYFCDLGLIRESDVFINLYDIDKDLIAEYFNRCINENTPIDYSIALEPDQNIFNILEAKRFFGQQYLVVLENSQNDSRFIEVLSEVFRKHGKRFRRHYENGWLDYGNAGGCTNIINFIEGKKKAFRALPKQNEKYLRCYVVIDSDKRFPDDSSDTRKRLITYLEKNDVPYHILEKREMENYMPDEIISGFEMDQTYFSAYLRLNEIQKDFFDLEKGFNVNRKTNLHPKVNSLYEEISEQDFDILKKGVDKRFKIKNEFPKKMEQATREQLLKRTAHQTNPKELEDLIKEISELL